MTKSVTISDIQKLAIPALISGIAEPILSITDTIIVGNMLENAKISLGAVGIVGSFISMLIWVFGQTRSVIASIIANFYWEAMVFLYMRKKLPYQLFDPILEVINDPTVFNDTLMM